MSLYSYLERQGMDPEVDPDSLPVLVATQRAVETAYYRACLSDSTYHGVNQGAKVNTVSLVVKDDRWSQFSTEDFEMLDRLVDKVIEERRS